MSKKSIIFISLITISAVAVIYFMTHKDDKGFTSTGGNSDWVKYYYESVAAKYEDAEEMPPQSSPQYYPGIDVVTPVVDYFVWKGPSGYGRIESYVDSTEYNFIRFTVNDLYIKAFPNELEIIKDNQLVAKVEFEFSDNDKLKSGEELFVTPQFTFGDEKSIGGYMLDSVKIKAPDLGEYFSTDMPYSDEILDALTTQFSNIQWFPSQVFFASLKDGEYYPNCDSTDSIIAIYSAQYSTTYYDTYTKYFDNHDAFNTYYVYQFCDVIVNADGTIDFTKRWEEGPYKTYDAALNAVWYGDKYGWEFGKVNNLVNVWPCYDTSPSSSTGKAVIELSAEYQKDYDTMISDNIMLSVDIKNNPGVCFFELCIKYDSDKLEPIRLVNSDFTTFNHFASYCKGNNEIIVQFYEPNNVGFSNNGNLFTILFRPIYGETGTAVFEISSTTNEYGYDLIKGGDISSIECDFFGCSVELE